MKTSNLPHLRLLLLIPTATSPLALKLALTPQTFPSATAVPFIPRLVDTPYSRRHHFKQMAVWIAEVKCFAPIFPRLPLLNWDALFSQCSHLAKSERAIAKAM